MHEHKGGSVFRFIYSCDKDVDTAGACKRIKKIMTIKIREFQLAEKKITKANCVSKQREALGWGPF